MEYDEIKENQRVRITVGKRNKGTVKAKEITEHGPESHRYEVQRVYVDTDRGGRELCHPSVLELVTD